MKTMWQVELVESVPEDRYGEADIDQAEYRTERFPTRARALAFAAKVIVGKPWECADLYEVRRTSPTEIQEGFANEDDSDYWREENEWWVRVSQKEEVSSNAVTGVCDVYVK